jgi:hypothetical protein
MKKRYASSRAERVTWLLQHPELWENIYQPGPALRALGRKMREAGLYSAKTTPRTFPLYNMLLEASEILSAVEDAAATVRRDFEAELEAARAAEPWPKGLPRFSTMGARV